MFVVVIAKLNCIRISRILHTCWILATIYRQGVTSCSTGRCFKFVSDYFSLLAFLSNELYIGWIGSLNAVQSFNVKSPTDELTEILYSLVHHCPDMIKIFLKTGFWLDTKSSVHSSHNRELVITPTVITLLPSNGLWPSCSCQNCCGNNILTCNYCFCLPAFFIWARACIKVNFPWKNGKDLNCCLKLCKSTRGYSCDPADSAWSISDTYKNERTYQTVGCTGWSEPALFVYAVCTLFGLSRLTLLSVPLIKVVVIHSKTNCYLQKICSVFDSLSRLLIIWQLTNYCWILTQNVGIKSSKYLDEVLEWPV